MDKWKREDNMVYTLSERGYNKLWGAFYGQRSEGAIPGETEALAVKVCAMLNGRDPVKAQMLAALKREVEISPCDCVDLPESDRPCSTCQMEAAIRAAEEEQ